MKVDFPAVDELEEEMERLANECENLLFTKKSKMTHFMSKYVQKKKPRMTSKSLPTKSQKTTESVIINHKTNPQPLTETPPSTTNTVAPTPAQEKC